MSEILKTRNLKKAYKRRVALCNVNMEISEGKIIGLVGPNGSGKTTLMKLAAGLLRPTSGEIKIFGKAPGIESKSKVSYLPDINFLFKWMKVKDALSFFNDLYTDFDIIKAGKLLEYMKLSLEDETTSLSKGMLEKLHLVLVLSRRAKLYILDEPLGGIDPIARDTIMDTIISNFNEGSSMIISTHLIRDIERIFDEIIFISDGEVVLQGDVEELRISRGKSMDELYREVCR